MLDKSEDTEMRQKSKGEERDVRAEVMERLDGALLGWGWDTSRGARGTCRCRYHESSRKWSFLQDWLQYQTTRMMEKGGSKVPSW